MSIILGIKTPRCAVVAADSHCNSRASAGTAEIPYDRTFHIASVIGAYAGLSELAGLDVKQHIANVLVAKSLRPRDAIDALEEHIGPLLQGVAAEHVAFEDRELEIIVASREEIALLRFWPNPQRRAIEAQHRLDQIWFVAGTEPVRDQAAARLSKLRGLTSSTRNPALTVAQEIVEAAIAACENRSRQQGGAQCVLPVSLRIV